ACGIELDDRWSELAAVQVALDHVLPIQDEDMVLGVHTGAAKPSQHPAVGQRLRPRQIGLVARRNRLCVHRGCVHDSGSNRQYADFDEKIRLHVSSPVSPPMNWAGISISNLQTLQ